MGWGLPNCGEGGQEAGSPLRVLRMPGKGRGDPLADMEKGDKKLLHSTYWVPGPES